MENAEVEMTKPGFAVTHYRRDLLRSVRDEYVITVNGLLGIVEGRVIQ